MSHKQTLKWEPFTEGNRPPKSTCFFSDGVASYWAGWYTSDEGVGIYLALGNEGNRLMDDDVFRRVRFWADPGNFIKGTGEGWS